MRSPQHPCHTNRSFDSHSIKEEDKTHKARKLVIEMVFGHNTCITEKEKTHKTRKLVIDMLLGHDTPITEKGKTTKTTITSIDVPLMDIL